MPSKLVPYPMERSIRPVIITTVKPPPKIASIEICLKTVKMLLLVKKTSVLSEKKMQITMNAATVPYFLANVPKLIVLAFSIFPSGIIMPLHTLETYYNGIRKLHILGFH